MCKQGWSIMFLGPSICKVKKWKEGRVYTRILIKIRKKNKSTRSVEAVGILHGRRKTDVALRYALRSITVQPVYFISAPFAKGLYRHPCIDLSIASFKYTHIYIYKDILAYLKFIYIFSSLSPKITRVVLLSHNHQINVFGT